MIGRSRAALRRLGKFLETFEPCFVRRAQRGAVMRYVEGLCGPSERKNLKQMWESLEDPGDYQALHHFITGSTWSDSKVWSALREIIPEKRGVLVADDTGIPKNGTRSVGVQRQYSGTLGKIGNCQIAVSSILRTKKSSWLLAMDLYLPESWMSDRERRDAAEIPRNLEFRTKWQIAVDQARQIRKAGYQIDCVVADAGYGNSVEYRSAIDAMGLFYIAGIEPQTTVFESPPRSTWPPPRSAGGRARVRPVLKGEARSVSEVALRIPANVWRRIPAGRRRSPASKFAAIRVHPANGRFVGRSHPACWLLIERRATEVKYFFSNFAVAVSLKEMVMLLRNRWAIETNYRDIKNELGFDHFAGRSFEGWNHHAVLTALSYTFVELERRRGTSTKGRLTFPVVRKFVRKVFLCLHVAGDKDLYRTVVSFHKNPPLRI